MHLVTSSNFQFKKTHIVGLQIVFLSLLGTSFLHNCMHMSLPHCNDDLDKKWTNNFNVNLYQEGLVQKISILVCNLTKVPKVRPF